MVRLLILLFVFTSCLGTKKVTETNKETVQIEKSEVKKDSSNLEVINKKIDDEISTIVQRTGDPILDAKIDEILSRINTSKTSGDNSYRFYYDAQLRELRAEFEIGETKDKKVITNKEVVSETSFTEKTDEYIYKKIIALPWWAWLILVWLIRKHLINIIAIFIPGVRQIRTIQDLLNPPSKK